jgi:hypothetical protein
VAIFHAFRKFLIHKFSLPAYSRVYLKKIPLGQAALSQSNFKVLNADAGMTMCGKTLTGDRR